MGDFNLKNQAEPTTPSTDYTKFYVDSTTKLLTLKKDDGTTQAFDPDSAADFSTVTQTNKIGDPTHIDNLEEYINHMWSSGIVDQCEITDNGDGKINISAGSAVLRDSADAHGPIYSVEVAAQNNIEMTDDATNYVYLNYNGGSPVFAVTLSVTGFNCIDKCLAYVVHRTLNDLDIIDATEMTVDAGGKERRLFLEFTRFIHAEGGSVLSEVGIRNLSLTAGAFYFMVAKIPHGAFNTSTGSTFTYYHRDGASGWTLIPSSTQIDNTSYDDGSGTLATLGTNKYRVDEVRIVNNEPSRLMVVYGQAEYNSLAEAQAAGLLTSIPSVAVGMGALVGRVIVVKGGTNLADVESAFLTTFTSSAPTSHNELAGLDGGEAGFYGHLSISAQNISGHKTFTDDVTINGNFTVLGTTTSIQTTNTEVTDNQITINSGESGAGVTAGKAGLLVDRGTLTDYEMIFDEADDSFKLGEIGSLQKVATREDAPNDTAVAFWDNATSKLATDSVFTYDSVNKRIGLLNNTPAYDIDIGDATSTAARIINLNRSGGNYLRMNCASADHQIISTQMISLAANTYVRIRAGGVTGLYANNVGISLFNGATSPVNERFYIKGATADATANVLKCVDSASSQLFSVRNDGQINFANAATYADDSAAGTGGLVAGDVYKTATGELRIKL